MIIELKEVKKEYSDGKNKKIIPLNNVNFFVNKGDLIAITGPSGVGKSTLLNIIGCIDEITSGQYYLNNVNTDDYTEREKSHIRNKYFGYVLQNNGLIPYRNVYDNVSVPLMFDKNIRKADYKEKIEKALEDVNMADCIYRNVNELSGGEKQRISIARAIVNDPEIILADEPTGALDVDNKDMIVEQLFQLNAKGKTVIIVTHDLDIADKVKMQYVFTQGGKLCAG
ncbi:MAG: ABC transporter ATP-binding protein [Clostridium sp.]|nr:ABC transporter ATP-binding protein [Clostridium sp.]MCM1460769.1 ABC transporter ATP-binding protein [Bacteroides sp.]